MTGPCGLGGGWIRVCSAIQKFSHFHPSRPSDILSPMKIFFDTEFHEDGSTIDLISLGAVREDGGEFYVVSADFDYERASANPWLRDNVLSQLTPADPKMSRKLLSQVFRDFCGDSPEFWAYYADYDWVALCQLYGTMLDLPKGWPMFCMDIKQWCVQLGDPKLPDQGKGEHNALADARWNKVAYEFLAGKR